MIRDECILWRSVVGKVLILVWVVLVGVGGCSVGKRGEQGAAAADTGVRREVAVGDRLRVSIFELVAPGETFAVDLVVEEDGFVDVPKAGRVRVEGLTIEGVEKVLRERLSWDGMRGVSRGMGPEVRVERVK